MKIIKEIKFYDEEIEKLLLNEVLDNKSKFIKIPNKLIETMFKISPSLKDKTNNSKIGLIYYKDNKNSYEEFIKVSPLRKYEYKNSIIETINTIKNINHSLYIILNNENKEYKLYLAYLKTDKEIFKDIINSDIEELQREENIWVLT